MFQKVSRLHALHHRRESRDRQSHRSESCQRWSQHHHRRQDRRTPPKTTRNHLYCRARGWAANWLNANIHSAEYGLIRGWNYFPTNAPFPPVCFKKCSEQLNYFKHVREVFKPTGFDRNWTCTWDLVMEDGDANVTFPWFVLTSARWC